MKSFIGRSAVLVVLALCAGEVLGQGSVPTLECVQRESVQLRAPRSEVVLDDRGENAYRVNANESWRSTGVEVKRGQKVEIAAYGTVRWAQDGTAWTIVTPDGTAAPRLQKFPHPDAGIGSLVMRIGKGVYPAGTAVTIEAEDDGVVEFMINDDVLADNSGYFLVRVSVLGVSFASRAK